MDIENWLKNKRTIFLEKKNSREANQYGYVTNRKLVVIESDDWGSIRMPSKEICEEIRKTDVNIDRHPFFRYDGLAGVRDLENLYEVLSSVKDQNGKHPVFTANCAVANPDFDAIRKAEFERYYYEPFTSTLKKTKGCEDAFTLWKQGMKDEIFYPQLHCREHFNVTRWMADLQNRDAWLIMAFNHEMISTASCKRKENENTYMDAFNYDRIDERDVLAEILTDAVSLFKRIFGYQSESFIASCYIWGHELEKVMYKNGIRYIQGEPLQRIPSNSTGTSNMGQIRHYMGDTNEYGQHYLIRNCNFEPSFNPNKDWVDIALNGIDIAFQNQKPAVICSHRLNYIGRIDQKNSDQNLKSLEILLNQIVWRWPDVEFITSVELGRIIGENHESEHI
mgnify:FL=1